MVLLPGRSDFPEGFLFGAATAAYQIEGTAFGGCGPSHWDTFAATPGNVVRAENGSRACDHYHLWAEDLDLCRGAGLDAYRFSINWARLMPDGRKLNPSGVAFYDRLIDGMLARGLQPFLTLYHWDLPSALADRGGWTNRDTCTAFADYAARAATLYGDRIATVATINEPWCVAWLSHFLGHHAPGLRDIRAAARAMHHVLLAHGMATQAMRAQGQRHIGIVLNFDHALPASDRPEDQAAARLQDAIFNRWFIEGITCAAYPAEVLAGLGPHMPDRWQDDMATIAQPLDWLGVNYYTRHFHAADPGAPWPATREVDGPLPKTAMGWEIHPEGLDHFLIRLARDHVGDLPLFVTENGMAGEDRIEGGTVDDAARIAFLGAHLTACRRAIDAGANLRGFFYWSLLDNFEWAFGYEKRFGLVHVDFATLARTPKASYHAWAEALRRQTQGIANR